MQTSRYHFRKIFIIFFNRSLVTSFPLHIASHWGDSKCKCIKICQFSLVKLLFTHLDWNHATCIVLTIAERSYLFKTSTFQWKIKWNAFGSFILLQLLSLKMLKRRSSIQMNYTNEIASIAEEEKECFFCVCVRFCPSSICLLAWQPVYIVERTH